MIERFLNSRKSTVALCQNLETEDFVVQPVAEVSPPKWHLAHTTWFLEELLLNKYQKNYQFHDEVYRKLFNSYYKGLGEHWLQKERGMLSRPSVKEVLDYRKATDEKIFELHGENRSNPKFQAIMELAINHEEQHQELLLMDIKYILGSNPKKPAYSKSQLKKIVPREAVWKSIDEGIYTVGADRNAPQFAFDNELPVHKVYLHPASVRDKLVTNSEFLEFIHDGGYNSPTLWLSLGYDWVKATKTNAPLYWSQSKTHLSEFTLHGEVELDMNAPVTHINYFEADAFARWKGMRLPTEEEMEILSQKKISRTPSSDIFHPQSSGAFDKQLWCWTKSHYSAYPGYLPYEGEIGEYNGKFMCNQFVLKGGCMATPEGHYRNTYRNFFLPDQRWMFGGLTLAKDET